MARKRKVQDASVEGRQRFRVVRPAAYVEVGSRHEGDVPGCVRLFVDGRVVVVEDWVSREWGGKSQPEVTVGDLREALGLLEALSLDES